MKTKKKVSRSEHQQQLGIERTVTHIKEICIFIFALIIAVILGFSTGYISPPVEISDQQEILDRIENIEKNIQRING